MDKSLVEKEMHNTIGVQDAGLCVYNDDRVKERDERGKSLEGVNAVDSLASRKQMRFYA